MSGEVRLNEHEPMPEGEEPPPPGVRGMAIFRWILLGFAALLAVVMWGAWLRERSGAHVTAAAVAAPKYHCPMHPQVVSNEPGECPICHMDLVALSSDRSPPSSPDAGGMGVGAHEEDGGIPLGTTAITLSLDRVQSIGVRTAIAEVGALSGGLRVTALVQPPEQGAAEVHVRTAGFVEAIHVDQTGQEVAAGQPLLHVYSPEILAAENELLATRSWATDASSLPQAARNKLELLGMTAADIDAVVGKREPMRAIAVVAPRRGYVTRKSVVLGSYVTPEMALYEIQDLSRVYVVADVFLRDVALVNVGTEARFVPTGRPNDAVMGKIDLVYPLLDREARTRRVRLQVANERSRKFAPGEYGVLEVAAPAMHTVTVPRDALVDTGTATYVFVVEGEGHFVPRTVTISGGEGERVGIARGVEPGDRVVSGATFLIDSESRLQASVAQPPATGASEQGTAPPSSCDREFDATHYPEQHAVCLQCEQVHRGMGSMVEDCKKAIARP